MSIENFNKVKNLFRIFNLNSKIEINGSKAQIKLESNSFEAGAATYFDLKKSFKQLESQQLVSALQIPADGFTLRRNESVQIADGITADGQSKQPNITLTVDKSWLEQVENQINFDFDIP